jgi:diacylglycerol kinase (ATP)
MRVVLLHNPSAGRGDHSADDLIDEIRRAGHAVVFHTSSHKELTKELLQGCDLVAVAGGDGTVGSAAKVLRGTGIPFTVLALGTASNIARTLDIDASGSTRDQIAAWRDAEVQGFDVAVADFGEQPKRFFEALGFGVFPRVMRQSERARSKAEDRGAAPLDPAAQLASDLAMLRARLLKAKPKRYQVTIDGRDRSGDYLLVEVLNVPMIGPNVPLAPGASPADGRLDVVLVGEEARARLVDVIDRLGRGEAPSLELEAAPAETVTIAGTWSRYHRDGDLCKAPARSLAIRIEHHALRVLRPRRALTSSP